ncbi:MAG: TraM recognition domain-containing protein, partial [Pseudobdellovibrionaceae bacterium]|nr:TraM recognition domain-containing protein [Pseudobdellovibrionaceae bacterium]
LAKSMATSLGFRLNIVLTYQAPTDLLNLPDVTMNGAYVLNSINTNSQVKIVYGGADEETAKWVSGYTGEVTKNVAKMERTEFNELGGEKWQEARAIGTEKEELIAKNVFLVLPPRVCIIKQPGRLAEVMFTSHCPVEDKSKLEEYLSSKEGRDPSDGDTQPPAASPGASQLVAGPEPAPKAGNDPPRPAPSKSSKGKPKTAKTPLKAAPVATSPSSQETESKAPLQGLAVQTKVGSSDLNDLMTDLFPDSPVDCDLDVPLGIQCPQSGSPDESSKSPAQASTDAISLFLEDHGH